MKVSLLELLPKIASTIDKAAVDDKSSFKSMQARLIAIFKSIIANGLPPPIVRLVCTCLDKIFSHDLSSLYALVDDLQKAAAASIKKDLTDPGLISILNCLAYLSFKLGGVMATSASSTLSIVKSLLTATTRITPSNDLLRSRAMHLLASLCEGIHPADKASPSVHNEGWLVFSRHHTDTAHSDEARVQCIKILRAIARSRSSTLWLDGGVRFSEAVKICTSSLLSLSPAHPNIQDSVSFCH